MVLFTSGAWSSNYRLRTTSHLGPDKYITSRVLGETATTQWLIPFNSSWYCMSLELHISICYGCILKWVTGYHKFIKTYNPTAGLPFTDSCLPTPRLSNALSQATTLFQCSLSLIAVLCQTRSLATLQLDQICYPKFEIKQKLCRKICQFIFQPPGSVRKASGLPRSVHRITSFCSDALTGVWIIAICFRGKKFSH